MSKTYNEAKSRRGLYRETEQMKRLEKDMMKRILIAGIEVYVEPGGTKEKKINLMLKNNRLIQKRLN